MSDLLLHPDAREPALAAHSDTANPIGLDGIEFVEYATSRPQALGQVLEMMGFRPVARHRSREVLLYRQGTVNVVVNAHPDDGAIGSGDQPPALSAIAVRVRDARAAWAHVLEHGGWEAPSNPGPMELVIPAIHGAGGTRIYFVDRWKDLSIWDVDFVPIPGVDLHPPALAGMQCFGVVQYIASGRSDDWIAFWQQLFGLELIPDEMRFGIMPSGTLMRAPALSAGGRFMLQLVEPHPDADDHRERLHRIGLGVPDVPAAVRELRARGIEFVETEATHTERRGALTKTWLGGVVFELVHSEAQP